MAQVPYPETLRVIYEAAQRRLDKQFRSIENLDQKIGILIGLSGVILSVVLTLSRDTERGLYGLGIAFIMFGIV